MTSYLIDTHVWVWDLREDGRLPERIICEIDSAHFVSVSVVSIYEVAQKVRLGKWPEMTDLADRLATLVDQQGYSSLALSAEVSHIAGLMEWDHRDPFDRMIAATAIHLQLPLISADTAFDQLSTRKDWPGRVW